MMASVCLEILSVTIRPIVRMVKMRRNAMVWRLLSWTPIYITQVYKASHRCKTPCPLITASLLIAVLFTFRDTQNQVSVLGQVIEQHYGIWHTKCYPRENPPDLLEVQRVCRSMGYNGQLRPTFRIIDDNARRDGNVLQSLAQFFNARSSSSLPLASTSRQYRSPTKAAILTKFSPVDINKFRILIRASRPLAELVPWDEDDLQRCLRLEIKCLQ